MAVLTASGEDFYSSGLTTKEWTAGFSRLFNAATYGDPTAARIIIGTSPFFTTEPPNCLSAHGNPQRCALHVAGSTYAQYVARDKSAAKASGAKLINVEPWFCHKGTCSVVIGHYLAFSDTDHVTIAYSDYIAPLVTNAVLAALK